MKAIKLVLLTVVLSILFGGCTKTKSIDAVNRFGPDPYRIECVEGEVWIDSEHGRAQLGARCEMQEINSKPSSTNSDGSNP